MSEKQTKSTELRDVLVNDLITRIRDGEVIVKDGGDGKDITVTVRCVPAVLTAAIAYLKQHPADQEVPLPDGLGAELAKYTQGMAFASDGPKLPQ